MIINLRDYRKTETFFEFDLLTGIISHTLRHPKQTSGYCLVKENKFFSNDRMFVAIFIDDQSVFVILNSKKYKIDSKSKITFSIRKRFGISIFRKFLVIEEGICINQINYISFSNSKEEWPDDYSDIFRFIVNTLSKKFDPLLLSQDLVEK